MSKVLVVGGGAAGMFAAIFAAYNGNEVHIFEKNEKLGKKLFITGKGRCNITNASDMDTLFASVVTNPKFLYSSFYGYDNQNVIEFFERIGVRTKVERGNRVFPVSDHSSDVIGALTKELHQLGVLIHLHTEVKRLSVKTDLNTWKRRMDKRLRETHVLLRQVGFLIRRPDRRETDIVLQKKQDIKLLILCRRLFRWSLKKLT